MIPTPNEPGPVEAAILASLAPAFTVRRAGPLRLVEGGAGSPLILLHGRGNAATTWFPLLPALARDRRVIAVDLPGFGSSTAPPFAGRGLDAGAAFFTDPIEAWILAEHIVDAAIVGHSLGGLVAVELALRGKAKPSRLALIGGMGLGPAMTLTGRAFFRAGPERLARWLGRSAFDRLTGAADTLEGARLADLGYELYAVPGGRPEASAAFDALCPLVGPVPHRGDRLSAITAPVLLVWGDHDEVFPAPTAIAAAAAFPRAELRIEPLGHAPHLEAPGRILPILEGFLG